MNINREIHKKTGQVVYNIRRAGGRRRFDAVTYIGQDEAGNQVKITATEYRGFIDAYRVGDVITDRPDYKTQITALTQRTKNNLVAEITKTYKKAAGIRQPGDTDTWAEEMPGRMI